MSQRKSTYVILYPSPIGYGFFQCCTCFFISVSPCLASFDALSLAMLYLLTSLCLSQCFTSFETLHSSMFHHTPSMVCPFHVFTSFNTVPLSILQLFQDFTYSIVLPLPVLYLFQRSSSFTALSLLMFYLFLCFTCFDALLIRNTFFPMIYFLRSSFPCYGSFN